MEFKHYSVMLSETVDALSVKDGGIYADGTLGSFYAAPGRGVLVPMIQQVTESN